MEKGSKILSEGPEQKNCLEAHLLLQKGEKLNNNLKILYCCKNN